MNLEKAIQGHAEWKLKFRAAITRKERMDAVVIGAARALQQLEIIDHDQPDAVPPFQPPRTAAQRGDRQCRGVIDIERQIGQLLAGAGKLLEFLARQLAAALPGPGWGYLAAAPAVAG